MKLVVDSNVLFTHFWKASVFEQISCRSGIKLFAPEFALEEINRYSEELISKTKSTKDEFRKLRHELALKVEFIPQKEYGSSFKEIGVISRAFKKEEQDEFFKDADFLALALKLKCPLWSNDKLLKRQSKIDVFNTRELIDLLSSRSFK